MGRWSEGKRQFNGPNAFALCLAISGLSVLGRASAVDPQARETPAGLAEFEVASVKPAPDSRLLNTLLTYPGGRMVARGCTLRYLVMEAFQLRNFQVSGGAHWVEEERFDIEAKPPESSASSKSNPPLVKLPPNDEQRQMLQALLIDRFQLKFHRDTKEGKVYVLTAKDKGLKLQAPKDKNDFPWAGGMGGGMPDGAGLRGTNISMPQLALRISEWLARPVLDQTGLQGSFDFEFRSGENGTNSNDDIFSSILNSLKGTGLDLRTSKGPVETLVIDDVGKPSEN